MHCPECGQQQVSDEIRFCSRCGLPLSLIAEVAAHGGTLPEPETRHRFFNHRTGMFIGIVWILFFVVVLAPVMKILLKAPQDVVLLTCMFGIFIGVLILISSSLFLPGGPRDRHADDPEYGPRRFRDRRREREALPPERSMPASRWKTNDLAKNVAPPSVTDNTTKLLHEDGE